MLKASLPGERETAHAKVLMMMRAAWETFTKLELRWMNSPLCPANKTIAVWTNTTAGDELNDTCNGN